MVSPYVIVPTAPAVKLAFGIESIASEIIEGDGRWEAGILFQEPICGPAELYSNCFSIDPDESPSGEGIESIKEFVNGIPSVRNGAFSIYGGAECTPIGGFWNEAMSRSRDHLINGRERALENEVFFGTATGGSGQYLTDASTADVTPTPGTAVSVADGTALLEEWIGVNAAGRGAILGNRREILLGVAERAVNAPEVGDRTLYTGLGTPVAAVSGFDGNTGPGGTTPAAGTAWIYAIGSQIRIWRGSIFDIPRDQSVDIGYNNQFALTEQETSFAYQCGAAAVLVTTTTDSGGGGGGGNVTVTNFPASYPQPTTQRTQTTNRLTGGTDRAIPAGRRSYTVTVITAASPASPTLDGVALPAGYTATFTAPNNDTLAAAAVLTVAGDDVIVLEIS